MQKPTPMLAQFHEMKAKYPDCIVAFRMGDFYEMFFEDAKIASQVLNITLTKRGTNIDGTPIPLAGIPYHAYESYFGKLIKAGFKVAVAEQLEDPKKAKGLVKRGVIKVITPGTVFLSGALDEKRNNYIASISKTKTYGLAIADISTGEFTSGQFDTEEDLINEITRFNPSEMIIEENLYNKSTLIKPLKNLNNSVRLSPYPSNNYNTNKSEITLKNQLKVSSLDSFGITHYPDAIAASGALITYLRETQMTDLDHINKIRLHQSKNYMIIDPITLKNLELIRNIRENTSRGTLIETIDRTITSMGTRLLIQNILKPLQDPQKINSRLDAVEELMSDYIKKENIRDLLKECYDIERIISKISYGNANARDLNALKKTLELIPQLKQELASFTSKSLKKITEIPEPTNIIELIEKTISEDPPLSIREGRIIKKGYDEELDELRYLSTNAKDWLRAYEEQEKQKTGIKTLKVRYNKVFGYYIEVSKSYQNQVPDTYIRKQTTVNGERYITDTLKEKESQILGAEEKITTIEYNIFQNLLTEIAAHTDRIQYTAKAIATLDYYASLAHLAHESNYTRPKINTNGLIEIKDARHPVVETLTDNYITNDVNLNPNTENLIIITGPNMAGKSTYMRSVCLITLMAHIGSFVPATSANISITDRIFTRIGAYDDLTMGQSTFMVEMNETSNILNNATKNSLVILDEIGRGTSTLDGLSLAWATAEYIHENLKAKTIFATHFHQLNVLEDELKGVKNYHMTATEEGETIRFLRKLKVGGTDKSYGIAVAKLSGIPNAVIDRAKNIQVGLEKEDMTMIKRYKLTPTTQKSLTAHKTAKKSKPVDEKQRTLF